MPRLTEPRDVDETDIALRCARATWKRGLRDLDHDQTWRAQGRIDRLLEQRTEHARRAAGRRLGEWWRQSWPGGDEPAWPQSASAEEVGGVIAPTDRADMAPDPLRAATERSSNLRRGAALVEGLPSDSSLRVSRVADAAESAQDALARFGHVLHPRTRPDVQNIGHLDPLDGPRLVAYIVGMNARRVTDLAPFDQVVLAARPLLIDRVTAPRRDTHGVERVVVCGIDTVTGRNVAVITPADQPVVLCD